MKALTQSEFANLTLEPSLRERLKVTVAEGFAPDTPTERTIRFFERKGGVFTSGPFEGTQVTMLELTRAETVAAFALYTAQVTGKKLLLEFSPSGFGVLEAGTVPRILSVHDALADACVALALACLGTLEAAR